MVRPRKASRGIGHVVEGVLAALDLVAGIGHIGAEEIETGGDQRHRIVWIKLIARQLFANEARIGLVGIEGGNDIVAVAPGVGADLIVFVAVAVGIAGEIEPMPPPTLAIVRRGQQPVDHFLPGIRRGIVDEIVDFFWSRGRPMRSNVTRRISCSREADEAGLSPLDSNLARMKASMGFRTHFPSFTAGTSGHTGGFQAQ